MARTKELAAAVVAGIVLAGASAVAPTAPAARLTETEVRSFVGRMVDEAESAAASGEWKSATDWMRTHFSGGGTFALRGAVVSAGRPPFTYDATLDGDDISAVAEMATDGPVGAALSAVSDYSATAEVAYVDLLPNGEASAEVEIREKALLDLAQLSGKAAAAVEAAGAGPVALHSTSTCLLRLTEGADGNILIRLGACVTTTTF